MKYTTSQVSTESNACVSFHTMVFPLSFLFIRTPKFKEWYSIDTNFYGSPWTLSIRGDATSREYMIWNNTNTGNINTSKIYIDSTTVRNIPVTAIFSWALCTMSDLITAHWARFSFNPFSYARKVKDV